VWPGEIFSGAIKFFCRSGMFCTDAFLIATGSAHLIWELPSAVRHKAGILSFVFEVLANFLLAKAESK